MGRINRTGQILAPIYDYLISNIPAEKRLFMMLQKRLRALMQTPQVIKKAAMIY